jgi:C-terminal processing protease CtpA/Prc
MKGNADDKTGGMATRGRVGFTVSLLDGKPSVTGVRPGFPGEQAGLKQGELVTAVNGRSTEGLGNGALDYIASGRVDQPMTVTVQPREGGAPRNLTINRVPMDFDPSRPGATSSSAAAHPATASAQQPARAP